MLRLPRRLVVLASLALALSFGLASSVAHADPSFANPADPPQVGPLFRPHAPRTVARAFDGLLADVRRRVAAGERPIVVFDLDDTLFRGQPHYADATILPGAAAFVGRLAAAGASIAYVTGRPRSIAAGTRAQLRAAGLPIGGTHRLYVQHAGRSGVGSKQGHLATLARRGAIVGAFENEARNTRLFQDRLPGARIFHHATRTSVADPARERGRKGLTVFNGFPAPRAPRAPRR